MLVEYQPASARGVLSHGQEHPLVASSFNNLGVVYERKGDLENAIVQHQKALEVFLAVNTARSTRTCCIQGKHRSSL